MRLEQHAAIGSAVALPLAFYSPAMAAALLASTVLIDVDHLLFYVALTRRVPTSPRAAVADYQRWKYYGPRVMIFHNYETMIAVGLCAWATNGILVAVLGGVLLHMLLDQVPGFLRHRFLRVRTLVGDVARYREYTRAVRAGREEDFMVSYRDSWWGHLRQSMTENEARGVSSACGILGTHPERPLRAGDGGRWGAWW